MDFSDYAVNIAIVAFGLMFVFLILMSVLNVIDFFTGFISGKPFQSYHKRWGLDKPERANMNGNETKKTSGNMAPGWAEHSSSEGGGWAEYSNMPYDAYDD